MAVIRQKIALNDIRFFAHHGFYPEEQKTGNEFFVNIAVEFIAAPNFNDELAETINYERLYEIASLNMKTSKMTCILLPCLVSLKRLY